MPPVAATPLPSTRTGRRRKTSSVAVRANAPKVSPMNPTHLPDASIQKAAVIAATSPAIHTSKAIPFSGSSSQ